MNAQQDPESNPAAEGLTTEQFANAGAEPTRAAEPRAFDSGEARPDGARQPAEGRTPPLLPPDEADNLRQSWHTIQGGFVDEPRRAVEEADQLVAQTMKRLAEVFAQERSGLEAQWDRGDDVSTEELRIALQRYRSFFDRLLAI